MPDLEPNTVPIAIIGIGCRFAGDATSPEALWEMLESGQSAWSQIPASRFNLKGWYHPNHENISTVIHEISKSRLIELQIESPNSYNHWYLFRQTFEAGTSSRRIWARLTQISSGFPLKQPL